MQNNLLCHAEELVGNLAVALDYSIEEEIRLSEQVSDEEWEVIKPTKQERREAILNFMKVKKTSNDIFVYGPNYLRSKHEKLFPVSFRINKTILVNVIIVPYGISNQVNHGVWIIFIRAMLVYLK